MQVEEGSCLRKETAEKVEVGMLVTAVLESRARKAVEERIGLA